MNNIKIKLRAELDVKFHVKLGDFLRWGEPSNPMQDEPPFMVVVIGKDYFSASAVRSCMGWNEVEALRSSAVNDIAAMGIFSNR